MKKILLFAVLTIFCLKANAQDEPSKGSEISFGLKGGLNFALISGDGTDNFDGRFAFHVGAVSEIPITEKFSVQPELLYSSQGDKGTFDGMDITFKLDYLNLPILAKYYVAERFSLEAGPQIGFLLSSKAEGGGVSIDIKELFKSIDLGLGFGLGYKLENGINFTGRFNAGITNIIENNGYILDVPIDSEGSSNFNNVFQLSVGYFF